MEKNDSSRSERSRSLKIIKSNYSLITIIAEWFPCKNHIDFKYMEQRIISFPLCKKWGRDQLTIFNCRTSIFVITYSN